MENLPSILTPDLGLLFWMLLAFVVVFLVLAKYGFPAILNMVDSRNRFINDNLRKAKEAAERLEHIKDEGESILQEARNKLPSSRRLLPRAMPSSRRHRKRHVSRVQGL